MAMNTLFILTESIDEGIVRMWHFHVSDKYALAQFILANIAEYESVGKDSMFRGISWQSGLYNWHQSNERTSESLLEAIDNSSIDGDSESGFQIHAVQLSENGAEADDVTWTGEKELSELQRVHGKH